MKNVLWLFCPLLVGLLSCNDENLNDTDFLAGDAFTNSNVRVVLIDTLTIDISTLKMDSIVTSPATRMLVGQYSDPVFGTVRAASHMGLIPSEYAIDVEAEYDSITLHLNFDGYYYNDTTITNSVHVKRLLKTLHPAEGDNFYNTSTVEYHDEDLGVFTYDPRPVEADTLEVRLDDVLGQDLFGKLQDNLITNADEFVDYFKGIALIPGLDDDGSVIGFSKEIGASFIRIHFGIAEEDERISDHIDLQFNLNETRVPFFNQISTEAPIDPLQMLTDQEINLSSHDAAGQSFIQSGLGITTRVEFPSLKSIYEINGQGTIMDAILKITPVAGSYNDQLLLRDGFSVFIVDRNNDVIAQLAIDEVFPVTGVLNRDNEEFNDIYYEISLVNYLDELLQSEYETGEALILLPEDFGSTVDRFVLNGAGAGDNSAQLELTYAIYDEDDN
ncbi:DUF4270 family protein [Flagellimonas algicola]|uniref:DUF4270 domain-containing protein n=1 Tax=Flagellimonas algicola TaxID=2583815 RepID=A0ABY2WGG3_9FLAO|nr:DUF4270 family protein [Allomuricauda algicola]TMU50447.1 DUF4270 domain-containing protein [Allomuricauda algicola]